MKVDGYTELKPIGKFQYKKQKSEVEEFRIKAVGRAQLEGAGKATG